MPFVDLSVRVDPGNPHALREHLVCCLDLGYQAVALDTRVEATDRNARAELLRFAFAASKASATP